MASLNSGGGPVGPAGFLFRVETLSIEGALLGLGIGVFLVARLCFLVRFSERDQAAERAAMERATQDRAAAEEGLLAPAPGELKRSARKSRIPEPTGTARHDRVAPLLIFGRCPSSRAEIGYNPARAHLV